MSDHAWGVGIATLDSHGATLDVRFRTVGLGKFSSADAVKLIERRTAPRGEE